MERGSSRAESRFARAHGSDLLVPLRHGVPSEVQRRSGADLASGSPGGRQYPLLRRAIPFIVQAGKDLAGFWIDFLRRARVITDQAATGRLPVYPAAGSCAVMVWGAGDL